MKKKVIILSLAAVDEAASLSAMSHLKKMGWTIDHENLTEFTEAMLEPTLPHAIVHLLNHDWNLGNNDKHIRELSKARQIFKGQVTRIKNLAKY